MKAVELKKKYLDFFKKRGHAVIKGAPLIPEHDPSVLFTTAGMHPLVPFLLGQPHPQGKRLTDVQKCIRTNDIDDVGDDTHLTFFEMLGNWSLGDYFKKEAITWSYEFLTQVLKINASKLHVTVFAGDKDAPRDEESAKVWLSLGIPKSRIYCLPKEDNWWDPPGETGPCGPDTEMFVDSGKPKCSAKCVPGCGCGKYFEVWNDVFMEYDKTKQGKYVKLKQKNVDTGMGVERTIAMIQGRKSVYETERLAPLIKEVERLSGKKYGINKGITRAMRIIADHLRAAAFIIADGVLPSNVEQGYVLRRLIRRAVRYGKELGLKEFAKQIVRKVFPIYNEYDGLQKSKEKILNELQKEIDKFEKTLEKGLRVCEKIFSKKNPIKKDKYVLFQQLETKVSILKQIFEKKRKGKPYAVKEANISEAEFDKATVSGKEAFYLYQSFGFPIEMILELAREKCLFVHRGDFTRELAKHQELSRIGAEKKFKGGLADSSIETTKLHTATHLLAEALRRVLKKDVRQKGSNITPERLRFDFNFDRKVTRDELDKVEALVNQQIKKALPIVKKEMSYDEAKKLGAHAEFEHKYGEKVFVYLINDFSKEVCGGPHVKNTKELGKFKIIKEESIAAGTRRIKAVLD